MTSEDKRREALRALAGVAPESVAPIPSTGVNTPLRLTVNPDWLEGITDAAAEVRAMIPKTKHAGDAALLKRAADRIERLARG